MGPPPSDSSDIQNKLREDPPQINAPTQEPTEFITGITDPDNIFLGSALALWPEDELQDIEETEVTPIELEDDSSHVICPTCYDFLPKARYLSHRHSRDCHPPTRPPEIAGEHSLETRCRTTRGKNYSARSELTGKRAPTQKSEWALADRPLAIGKAKQHEMQYWSAIRDKMTAIYKKALRKPNVDGTYNVNGQITSLQELKRQIWNLPRCF